MYKLWSSLCKFLHPPATSPISGPDILLSTQFSNTLGLCSSLSVRDQVSHPYKTIDTLIVLYTCILIFTFLDTDGKTRDTESMVADSRRILSIRNSFLSSFMIQRGIEVRISQETWRWPKLGRNM
jgi:hypothetical protein